jgi:hypothetical protein
MTGARMKSGAARSVELGQLERFPDCIRATGILSRHAAATRITGLDSLLAMRLRMNPIVYAEKEAER